jgi:hypothetical protein
MYAASDSTRASSNFTAGGIHARSSTITIVPAAKSPKRWYLLVKAMQKNATKPVGIT